MVTPLRQRMSEDLRVRNLAVTTQKAYIDQVAKFARYFGKSPALLGPEEVRAYQVYLINDKKLGWSAFNGAVCALRFLYQNTLHVDWAFEKIPYAKRPRKRPVILSLDEVCSFLGAIPNLKHRVAAMTSYATGLRASEVLHLRLCRPGCSPFSNPSCLATRLLENRSACQLSFPGESSGQTPCKKNTRCRHTTCPPVLRELQGSNPADVEA